MLNGIVAEGGGKDECLNPLLSACVPGKEERLPQAAVLCVMPMGVSAEYNYCLMFLTAKSECSYVCPEPMMPRVQLFLKETG